jgi:transmembrane sensor
MTPTNEQIRTAIAEQAADWFIANQTDSSDEPARLAFVTWLKASPVHVEEYLGIAAIARTLRTAGTDPQISLESLLEQGRLDESDHVAIPDRAAPARPFWRAMWTPGRAITVAALAAVVAGFTLHWTIGLRLPDPIQTYETARGEHRSWQLSDGSLVQLNTQSQIRVRFTGTDRTIELTRGQAFFDVAHVARRPFIVSVGGAYALAHGTQFDVDTQDKTAVVTVVEGHVQVFSASLLAESLGTRALPGTVPAEFGLTLGAAQQARIDAGVVLAPPIAADLNQTEGWLHDQIMFKQRPLGEIADKFNRYSSILIEIPDASLRAVLVSGTLNARDTDSFVAFLQTLDGVTVRKTATRIYVLRPSTAAPADSPRP